MDWKPIIAELETDMTQAEIAKASGMASAGHVRNLRVGIQKTINYECGCRLLDLQRKLQRRRRREAAKENRSASQVAAAW